MSFVEFVLYLGGGAALGAVSSVLLQGIKRLFPAVKDDVAKIVSVVLAGLIAGLAVAAKPYLSQLPAWVETAWPIVVWLASQIWYSFVVKPAAK
ncbi:MAG: hypothetical protein BWX54_02090 [Verrucomicrobia bacterium ADurb.Bin018]|nr:MAG: hypothetical protein BWX54_02090 [Verrucomicrobia bacterium ADurb.Bin018]